MGILVGLSSSHPELEVQLDEALDRVGLPLGRSPIPESRLKALSGLSRSSGTGGGATMGVGCSAACAGLSYVEFREWRGAQGSSG